MVFEITYHYELTSGKVHNIVRELRPPLHPLGLIIGNSFPKINTPCEFQVSRNSGLVCALS